MREKIANALEREFIRKIEDGIKAINPENPLCYSNKDNLKVLPQVPQKLVWLEYADAVLKELGF